ncbi:MAG: hypothetical protein KAX93_04545, partial [Flavobacterium sp.]|nr:hypothetical protein [Flavobacterium sp.]
MVAVLQFILDFIQIDLIIGFGWYSIFYFIFRLFKYKKEFLTDFDKNACKTAVTLGVLFFGVWLLASSYNYFFEMDSETKLSYKQRLTGPYSFGLWLQPLFWLLLTQLLRIRLVRKFLLFRLMICLSFILTFERFVIIVTSLHRDYLPSSWSMFSWDFGISWWLFLLSLIIKIIEFAII